MDSNEKIHDWSKHGLKLLESTRKRVAKHRLQKRNCNVTVTPTLPNHTLPNHTLQKEKINKKENRFDALKAFKEIFSEYPNKIREDFARSFFFEVILTEETCQRVKKSVENYKIHLAAKNWKEPLEFKNFLKEWNQWENHVEPAKEETDAERDARILAKYQK